MDTSRNTDTGTGPGEDITTPTCSA
jgi:hypothetical protein